MEKYNLNEEVADETNDAITGLITVLSSFDQEDMNSVPFEGSWTAAQVGDHLLKSYGVIETLTGNTKKTERPPGQKIYSIKSQFLNFDIKMESPEFIVPTSSIIDKQTLITALEDKKAELIGIINTTDLAATCTDFEIPEAGEFTRLEWVHLVIYHTQRHIRQIKNIHQAITAKTKHQVT